MFFHPNLKLKKFKNNPSIDGLTLLIYRLSIARQSVGITEKQFAAWVRS